MLEEILPCIVYAGIPEASGMVAEPVEYEGFCLVLGMIMVAYGTYYIIDYTIFIKRMEYKIR